MLMQCTKQGRPRAGTGPPNFSYSKQSKEKRKRLANYATSQNTETDSTCSSKCRKIRTLLEAASASSPTTSLTSKVPSSAMKLVNDEAAAEAILSMVALSTARPDNFNAL